MCSPRIHDGRAFANLTALSCCHLVDQRRIIVAGAGLVDPPRYRPYAKAVLGGGPEKFGAFCASQPRSDVRILEHHRHAVMDRSPQLIGIRDDDRAAGYELGGLTTVTIIVFWLQLQHWNHLALLHA
jgi:hypothetical protein